MQYVISKKKQNSDTFLSPLSLIRISGLPSNVIGNLSLDKSIGLILEKRKLKQDIKKIKELVLEKIYLIVRLEEDDSIRKKLIKIKQDVSRDKLPRELKLYRSITNELDEEYKGIFNKWIDKVGRVEYLDDELSSVIEEEITDKRRYIQELVKNYDIQKGIILSSESLYEKMINYINTPIDKQNAKMRKIEKSLITYINRIATKTSPFSTFTPVSFGIFEESDLSNSNLDININDQDEKRSLVRINHLPILYLIQAAEKNRDINKRIPLEPNRTLKVQGDNIEFLKNTYSSENVLSKSITHKEYFTKIKSNKIIDYILNVIGSSKGITKEEVVNKIINSNATLNKNELYDFLDKLVDSGVIVCRFNVADNTKDIINEWLRELNEFGLNISDQLCKQLVSIKELISEYGIALPNKRLKIIEDVRKEYRDACELLGLPYKEFEPLIFEDTSYNNEIIKMDTNNWNNIENSLRDLQYLYMCFSINREPIKNFQKVFLDKFGNGGTCTNILAFLEEYHRVHMMNNGENSDISNDFGMKFYSYINSEISENKDKRTIYIDEDWLKSFNNSLPEEIDVKPNSSSYFIQPFKEDGTLKCVINRVGSGYGQFMSRFDDLFLEQNDLKFAEIIRESHNSLVPEDRIFAEINGVFGFNANIHSPITKYEISYPGIISNREPEFRLHLEDLILVHSTEENRLYLKSKNGEKIVYPLYLGFLNWFLLPSLYKLLFLFTPYSYSSISPAFEYHNNLDEMEKEKIIHIPEVRYKDVVLSREQWWVPISQMPVKSHNISDAEYLEKYVDWISKNGIPSKVFLNLKHDLLISRDNSKQSNIAFLKPQFIDFHNIWSIKNFEKNTELAQKYIVLEDVNPKSTQQITKGSLGNYTTEFVLELNRKY